jgi:hypothetical protein
MTLLDTDECCQPGVCFELVVKERKGKSTALGDAFFSGTYVPSFRITNGEG